VNDQVPLELGAFGAPAAYREVYRSLAFSDCEHRAFVLKAVGVEHVIARREHWYLVLVPEEQVAVASEHLARYAEENAASQRPSSVPLRLHEYALESTTVYVLVLVAIAYCAGEQTGGIDWFDIGALTASLASSGEWWRSVTALTLHADIGHLLGNLAFGGLFGYFAAQLLGPGSAWLSILLAGALGNLVDSALMFEGRVTIGASTAVFATLGMVAAYAWRRHAPGAARWAHRWAPLIAAVALLAFTGTAGERTDVLAHLTGFASGALFGALHAYPPTRRWVEKIPQSWAGALACVLIAGAWLWGFASGA